jgi:hypothetical protein
MQLHAVGAKLAANGLVCSDKFKAAQTHARACAGSCLSCLAALLQRHAWAQVVELEHEAFELCFGGCTGLSSFAM